MKALKTFYKNKSLFGMALPGLLWYAFFCYLPMFGLIIAFQNFNYDLGFLRSEFVGLENFKFLFASSDAFLITRNTICYNIFFLISNAVISVALAVIFNVMGQTKLNRLNQTVMLFPHFLSWVVASYFVFAMLSTEYGIANKIVNFFGGESIKWYYEPKYWPFILYICQSWKVVGYGSVIYYSTIRGFDPTYYEAAKVDGANWFQCITKITLPLLKPIVIIMLILDVGKIMRSDFGLFYIIPKNSGVLYDVTSTIDTYIYRGIKGTGDLGGTAAASMYQSFIGFILVMVTNLIVRKVSPDDALF